MRRVGGRWIQIVAPRPHSSSPHESSERVLQRRSGVAFMAWSMKVWLRTCWARYSKVADPRQGIANDLTTNGTKREGKRTLPDWRTGRESILQKRGVWTLGIYLSLWELGSKLGGLILGNTAWAIGVPKPRYPSSIRW